MWGRSGRRNGDQAKLKIFRNPGTAQAQPGMGLQMATRLFGLAGDHRDPDMETPAIRAKSPYWGYSAATGTETCRT